MTGGIISDKCLTIKYQAHTNFRKFYNQVTQMTERDVGRHFYLAPDGRFDSFESEPESIFEDLPAGR